jgi:hypothetical protein
VGSLTPDHRLTDKSRPYSASSGKYIQIKEFGKKILILKGEDLKNIIWAKILGNHTT